METPIAPVAASRRQARIHLGAAACLAFVVGMGATILHDDGERRRAAETTLAESTSAHREAEPTPTPTVSPTTAERAGSGQREGAISSSFVTPGSCGSEARCLERVWAALIGQDYRAALATLGEHRRRFPRGQLREEGDALGVLSLEGAGRTDEARRAAAAFVDRFPRSVLLPRIREATGTD
jgi:hypothetical protein